MEVIDLQVVQAELNKAREKAVEHFIVARAETVRWQKEIDRLDNEIRSLQ